MTPNALNEHDWFSAQIATYLAGGMIDPAERARFESHADSCESCAAELQAAQQLEGKMHAIFAEGVPDADFEDRLMTNLRFRLEKRRWVNPKVRKAAIVAAAAIVLAANGYISQQFLKTGGLPSFAFLDHGPFSQSNRSGTASAADDDFQVDKPIVNAQTPSSPARDYYYHGDTVAFEGHPIQIAAGTLSGAARSSGNALTSGAVTVSGGTLRLVDQGTPSAGSVGTMSFDGGSSYPARLVIDPGTAPPNTELSIGTLAGRMAGTTGALTNMGGQNRQVLVSNGTAAISEALPNGNLAKAGPGYLLLNNANSGYTGTLLAGANAPSVSIGNGNTVVDLAGKKSPNDVIASSGTGNLVVDNPTGVKIFNNASSNFQRLTIQGGNVNSTNGQLPNATALTVQNSGYVDLDGKVAFNTAADPKILASNIGERSLDAPKDLVVANGDIAFKPSVRPNIAAGNAAMTHHESTIATIGNDKQKNAETQSEINPDLTKNSMVLDYTFNGPGKNSDGPVPRKAGAGTLVIRTDNDYTGGTILSSGTLEVGKNALAIDVANAYDGDGGRNVGNQFKPGEILGLRGNLRLAEDTPPKTGVDQLTSSVSQQVASGLVASGGSHAISVDGPFSLTNSEKESRQPASTGVLPQMQLAQATSQPAGGPAGDANSGRAIAQPADAAQSPAQAAAASARRVIREGTMEFEVESFDSTFNQIATIVGEEGGFIAAADSDKLPNGKVRGTITVRVLPDRLDLLVLKLRALGELKSQKLGSRDVGKEYTDMESELRAARAMEARLLEMIAKAQGKVADLLEAEKELAQWRTKIEKITGTLNYYNNLISMATLTINADEKDIRTPASANITEEISTGVETEDVEAARNAALKAIDEAKGRIVESTLQKLEAGQFAAKIVAEVAPENAGPIVDRLKQLGRLARYDVQKKQVTEGAKNQNAPQTPARFETVPTRIVISMYNLANVAPRLTTNLNLAGDDVEGVYRAILKRVNDVNGRVVSSNLNRQDGAQITGAIQFEVKASDAEAVLNDVRQQGLVLRMVVTENPDTANITTAKQAVVLQIIPTAQLSAKLATNINVAAEDVEAAYNASLQRINASAGSRVISSNLNRQDAAQINGTIQFELKSEDADAVTNDLRLQGVVLRMNATESPDGQNITTTKRSYTLQILPMAALSPKLTTNLSLAAADVEGMYNSILKTVSASAGSRLITSNLIRQDAVQATGSLQFEVKADEAPGVLAEIRKNVQVLQMNVLENQDNWNVTTAKQAFVLQIIPASQVQPRETRTMGIQTSDVESAVQVVTAAVANAGGRMVDSSLSQDRSGRTAAGLVIEVPLEKTEQVADVIRKQGTVRNADSSRNTQIPDGPLARARMNITFATGETIVPTEGGFGATIRDGLSTSVKGLLWSLQLIIIGVCLVAPWLLLVWGGWKFFKKRRKTTPVG